MVRQIVVSNVTLNPTSYERKTVVSEKTGEELVEIEFELSVVGKNNYYLINNLLNSEKTVNIEVPEENLEFEATRQSIISSYQGELDWDTEVTFTATFRQKDSHDRVSDSEIIARFGVETVFNKLRHNSLVELLIESGVIKKEEFEVKFQSVCDRDLATELKRLTGVEKIDEE